MVLLKVAVVVVVVVADVVLDEEEEEEAVSSEVAAVLELIKAPVSSDAAAAHGHEHGAHTGGSSVDTTHIHATTNVTKQPTNTNKTDKTNTKS